MTKSTNQAKNNICFNDRDFFGSRYRCLLMTHLGKARLYERLNTLCKHPNVAISFDPQKDNYLPQGFCQPSEQMLTNLIDETIGKVLTEEKQLDLWNWWLEAGNRGTSTPTWDLISTCNIDNCRGLLLVEAKAYNGENSPAGKTNDSRTNIKNHEKIKGAIEQACDALDKITKLTWGIQRDSYYQLSNRFAWAWKLASLGVPVVLLYLGFLNAEDMQDKGKEIYQNQADLLSEFQGDDITRIVPFEAWEKPLGVNDTAGNKTLFIPLLRGLNCNVSLS
jgi:hypothetical protein